MPLPAMSWALPWATDENRIGVPMVSAAAGALRQHLGGDVALVVQHHADEGVEALHMEHRVGAERAGDVEAAGGRCVDRGLDGVDLLAPEQPAFAGVRIEAADGYSRRGDAHAPSVRAGPRR